MKKLIIVALTIAITALTYWWGYSHGQADAKHAETVADNERLSAAFEQGQALGQVKDRIVTQYVYRDRVIRARSQALANKVPEYVSEAADRACTLPVGFVRLHDAAAANLPAPEPGGSADGAGSGIALSAASAVVVENYGACNVIANRLTALQNYVRQHPAYSASGAPAPTPQ